MKLVIVLFLFLQTAFCAEFVYPDFKQCFEKNKNSFVYFGETRAIAISKNRAVAYSKTKPSQPYIKHDPFLNLYLFESKTPLKPVKLKSTNLLKVGEWIAGMDESSLFAGNFAKVGDVIDSFYLQNAKLDANSMVLCLCCEVYGLGVGGGSFIGSEYIKRFVENKTNIYGDVGARFEQRGQEFFVSELDPFFENQKLHIDDKILKIDTKKIYSLKGLNQQILFSQPEQKLTIELLRSGKILKLEVVVKQKNGGGALSDSFLEKKGIFLDNDMRIKKIIEGSFGQMSGLKTGDKLLEVEQLKMENSAALRKFFSTNKAKSVHMLFDRNDFQFFMTLDL